jgi:hypothetical protein
VIVAVYNHINIVDLDDLESDKEVDTDDDMLKQLEKEDEDKMDIDIEVIPKEEKIKLEEVKTIVNEDDIYPEKAEKMYHRPDKMKSMGVLQEEVTLVDSIIKYKKDKGLDYDYFEAKKDLLDVEIQKLQNLCECGAMDIVTYKRVIESQLKYEDILMEYLIRDKELSDTQRKILIERINKRKTIITEEMNQEIVEEPEPEPEPVPEKEEKHNDSVHKPEDGNGMKVDDEKKEIKNNTETKVEEKKPEIKDQRLYDIVWKKLDEYKEAIEYFKKIGSSAQEADATSKAKELVIAIRKLKEGQDVDEFSLPLSVSPEYITGYSQQERLNHFSTIIKEMSKSKNELINAKQAKIEKMKTVDKKDFNKFKDAFKKDLDHMESKINYYNTIIKTLTQAAKNPWVPAPLYKFIEEEEKHEKINESISPQNMIIHIGKSTYDKTHAFLEVSLGIIDINLALSDNKVLLEKDINFKTYPNYDKTILWKFEKSEFKNLFRRTLEIRIFLR